MQRSAQNNSRRTRLAPSPTGALHLGNARTFLVNWALARQNSWHIVLRVDDLDGPRIKPGADRQAIELLAWIGVDWDEGPYYQTARVAHYRAALERLRRSGRIYPCECNRSEIQAAQSAPHAGEHELRYPGCCRPAQPTSVSIEHLDRERVAWRFRVPDGPIVVHDQFAGEYQGHVQRDVGDFVIATKQGTASYQLAVVVDDVHQQIDCVIRGDDLLPSTPRQQLLYDALDFAPRPEYWHLPLVVGDDGRRLAKRHGDSRILHYRHVGVTPERIVGLMAEWCGIGPRAEMTADQFLRRFDLSRLPREEIVFSASDDRWLLAKL